MKKYLASTRYIDWQNPRVLQKARELASQVSEPQEIAVLCFKFVRDEIRHSGDFQINPVTVSAAEVLEHRTGFCYAKSHLLAALLRANGIPASLCYQRLALGSDRFCLHGLNAVFLQQFGWCRLDPRGNNAEVFSSFMPPHENLAFSASGLGEIDSKTLYAEPLVSVIETLTAADSVQQVIQRLPDLNAI